MVVDYLNTEIRLEVVVVTANDCVGLNICELENGLLGDVVGTVGSLQPHEARRLAEILLHAADIAQAAGDDWTAHPAEGAPDGM